MKTIKEMIEVMKAFDEGKTIQVYNIVEDGWIDWNKYDNDDEPTWDWRNQQYRIKPGSKKRPMTFEEIVAYWKEHRTEIFTVLYGEEDWKPTECFIVNVDYENNYIGFSNGRCFDMLDIIDRVRKEDGTKFEVVEE